MALTSLIHFVIYILSQDPVKSKIELFYAEKFVFISLYLLINDFFFKLIKHFKLHLCKTKKDLTIQKYGYLIFF